MVLVSAFALLQKQLCHVVTAPHNRDIFQVASTDSYLLFPNTGKSIKLSEFVSISWESRHPHGVGHQNRRSNG